MAFDQAQQAYLDRLSALPGVSMEDTRALVARFAFDEELEPDDVDATDLLVRVVNSLSGLTDVFIAAYGLGAAVQAGRSLPDDEADTGAAVAEIESPDPITAELGRPWSPDYPRREPLERAVADAFFGVEDEIDRTPDLRQPHAYTQLAMLHAIRRLADVAQEPQEMQALSDAYITLPPPTESR